MSPKTKKMILIGAVALLLIAVIVLVIVLVNSKEPEIPDIPVDPIVTEKSPAENIVVNPYNITNSSKNRDVRTSIPKLMNLSDSRFQEYMNKKMLQTVIDYQNEIETMIDSDTPAETLYKYVVSYETQANDIYLSMIVSNDYQTGGMRSNSWKDTYTIDVTEGANKEIFLKDLFDAEINYKEEILTEINSQAETKGYELVGGNGLSNLPDTQKFYIKDKKLVVYFDPAAIAPYVYGELHFEMPFEYKDGKFNVK